jgi:hypothetical protein
LSIPKQEEASFNERSDDEEIETPQIVIKTAAVEESKEESPSRKQETFKFNPNEMQETLKLIQKVTSSILEKGNDSFKSKAKPHVTRIVAPNTASQPSN